MKKLCKICSKEFETNYSIKTCCSPVCAKINFKNYCKEWEHSEKRKLYKSNYEHTPNRILYNKSPKRLESNRKYRKTHNYLTPNRILYNKSPKRLESNRKCGKKYYHERGGKEKKKLLQPTRYEYEHSEKRIKRNKEYRIEYTSRPGYKEKRKQYIKERWNLLPTTPLVNRRKGMKRRAAKNNIIEAFTPEQFLMKAEQCKGICPSCKKPFNKENKSNWLTVDHIYPVSKANEDFKVTGVKRIYSIEDVEPLCFGCNSSKRDKIINQ